MKTKLFKVGLAVALLAMLAAYALSGCTFDLKNAGSMASGNTKGFSQSVDMQGKYDEIRAEMDMFSANVSIDDTGSKLVDGNFKYSSEKLKPEFKVNGNSIEIKNERTDQKLIKPVNHWSVKLTDKAPVDFGITAAASQGRFDLSDIAVKNFELEADASSIKLYKDNPNVCELKRLDITTNAGDYELNGLGNMDFSRVDIDSKASRYMVDLSGEYKRDGVVRLKADASTMKLRVPDNVGVRIIVEKTNISTIIVENKDIVKYSSDGYQSRDYDGSDIKLTIYLDLNVTTVNII